MNEQHPAWSRSLAVALVVGVALGLLALVPRALPAALGQTSGPPGPIIIPFPTAVPSNSPTTMPVPSPLPSATPLPTLLVQPGIPVTLPNGVRVRVIPEEQDGVRITITGPNSFRLPDGTEVVLPTDAPDRTFVEISHDGFTVLTPRGECISAAPAASGAGKRFSLQQAVDQVPAFTPEAFGATGGGEEFAASCPNVITD
ncbi:MAG: hypothetical protein ACR2PL_10505 [Dehalococcoidia bacterium]